MATYLGISIRPYNDIEIDATGNLAMVTDAAAIGQHARQRLSLFAGEWFLDTTTGVDWFGTVLGGPGTAANQAVAEAIVKEIILATPGVIAISEITTSFDRSTRGVSVDRCIVETVFDEPTTV
jgi:hypothetical protein